MRIRLIASLMVLCSIASAKTYYVATPQNGGNDNYDGLASAYISGSRGPWASWEKAFTSASVQPGDTVFIRGGVYYTTVEIGTGIKLTRNGTSDNWIIYINYPGEKPIMDCNKITAEDIKYPGLRNDGISTNGVSYVKLIGLTIRNVKQYYNRNYARGFYLPDGIVNLENCTAYNIWGHGFHSTHNSGVGGIHNIINCDSYNNCDSLSGDPLGSNAGATGAGFDAWSDITSGETHFINCRAWGNSDQGYSIASDAYVKCDGCWSFANNSFIQGTGGGFKMGWQNIDVQFLRREMINCVAAFNDGYGFFTNEKGSGDAPDWNAVRSNHYNNIAYHNGYKITSAGFGFIIQDTKQAEIIEQWRNYSNNIDYDNYRKYVYTDGGLAEYSGSNNSWDIPLTLTDADFVSLDTTGITAPRQADGSLPDNDCYKNFLKLADGSQAINKGIDVGLPYSGTAPDLGAFEYISKSVIPPTPPVYLSSVIENTTPARLDMTYNMSLANIVPVASAFSVRVNSVARSISSVVVSGTKVQLTLSSPVVYGDVVTVAYTKPAANPLQTPAGGQAVSFAAKTVINNCILPVNKVPLINISSPGKSSSFTAPATITFDVLASDPDGTISRVEFFNGGSKLAETTTSPYFYTWKNVPAGTYSITAVATDNNNGRSVSEAITVVVNNLTTAINQLPEVVIVTPENNSSIEVPSKVILTANAYDPDGNISKVEYFNSNKKIGESSEAPYTVQFECLKAGNYEIIAVATDDLNAVASSFSVLLSAIPKNNPDIIALYPNPNDGRFTISLLTSYLAEENVLTIATLKGKVVYKGILLKEENLRYFDLPYLDSGIYILMIGSDKLVYTKKFVKK